MPAGGVRFTWVDHASDEEGYLLELRTPGSADYTVTEVLDPDVTSVGLLTLADQRSATVRVRAFYYGRPSNIAHAYAGPSQRPAIAATSPAGPGPRDRDHHA